MALTVDPTVDGMKKMPLIFVTVVLFLAFKLALALAVNAWLVAALAAICLIGCMRGNEGARRLVMLFGVVDAIWVISTGTLYSLSSAALFPFQSAIPGIVVAVLVAAINLFPVWVLRRRDVQEWMFHRSLPDL